MNWSIWPVALFLLATVGPIDGPAVKFLQPRAAVVNVGMGRADIPVQIRIEPHPANRYYMIAWDGIGCSGKSGHTLDGEYASAVHPIEPLNIQVTAGTCTIVVGVFGQGDKLLNRAEFTIEAQ